MKDYVPSDEERFEMRAAFGEGENVSKVEGVHADMLLDVIEEGTGLYASFSS